MVETPDGGMHLDPSLATYAIQDENKVLQSICDCIVSMASSQEMPSVSAITDEKDDVEGHEERAEEGEGGPSVSTGRGLSEVPKQDSSVRVAEVGHGAHAPPGSSSSKDLPVVMESELKARMGFRLLHGHREWRKYKVSNGLISGHCRLKGLEYGYLETLPPLLLLRPNWSLEAASSYSWHVSMERQLFASGCSR